MSRVFCSFFVNITIFNSYAKNCFKFFTCKHCERIFTSNNKLHIHIRLHYIKFNKTSKQRSFEKRNNHINLSISRFNFSITLMNSIAFKLSRRYEFTCMFFTILSSLFQTSILLYFTFSLNSFRISSLSHITSEIYMFINDLFEMFVEISNRKNKNIMQKNRFFRVFLNFVKFVSNRFVNKILKIQLCSREKNSKKMKHYT